MSIVANNSYRFNMSMDLWLLRDYTAGDLIEGWKRIFDFAKNNESSDNEDFLADCMDILYEKTKILPDVDREQVIGKAICDMDERKAGVA